MSRANKHRGQLGFEIPVEGQAEPQKWVFAFSTNALCAVEEEFDLNDITELESVLGGDGEGKRPSLRTVRKLFRIGLTDCHPTMSDHEAGEIMEAVGGLEPSLELILRAIETAFPEAARSGTGGPRETAPKAPIARGTGRGSTSRGARQS